MKTKIIYISGNEVFNMADIRGAFEEVRAALNLAGDTVLFGVPIDADDTGLMADSADKAELPATADIVMPDVTPDTAEDIVAEPVVVEKPKRARKPKAIAAVAEPAVTELEPVVEQTPAAEEKIIPILSILSVKSDETADSTEDPTENLTEDPIEDPADETPAEVKVVEPEVVEPKVAEPEVVHIETVAVEQVTIRQNNDARQVTTRTVAVEDIAIDEEPESVSEKTLEQLLEKMAPLREDISEEENTEDIVAISEDDDIVDADYESEVDATLERLAAEFATKQDKIAVQPVVEPAGKIGKLKNILPFKKAKREESGLMGDLFGWAGIAANDDEFSMPGFFTTTASKK
jgi:hypothetical protein